MSTPGLAILWQILWRWRWGLALTGIYLLVAVVLTHVLPTRWLQMQVQLGNEQMPAVAWFLGLPSLWANIMLVGVFAMTGNDIKNSGFTTHMFVLPVRTSTLVAWPMFAGCFTLAGVWLVTAGLIFRPGGIAAPLWWPAGALALFLVAFQAVSWTPFAQRWLQLALTVTVLMTLLVLIIIALLLTGTEFNVRGGQWIAAAAMLVFIPVAYLAAWSGVARARRGEPYDWRAWSRAMDWLAARRSGVKHAFASASQAQLWFECRAHAWTLPVFVGSMLLLLAFTSLIDRDDLALGWRLATILLVAPLTIAMVAGGALGNLHDPSSKPETAAFVLTRPVTSLSLLKAKLLAAAIGTLMTWILVLVVLTLFLFRPGFAESVGDVARSVTVWKAIAVPILALALLMFVTWKNTVENLWIALTGKDWISSAFVSAGMMLLFCGGGAGLWIYFHPEYHAMALAAVPWLIRSLLAGKLLVAAIVVWSLARSRLAGHTAIVLLLCGWCAMVIGFCALALWIVPAGQVSAANLVSGLALFVPFSRLAGAPLALEWNRHR
jgi:hypothetical protein